jgi:hypothetical protein
VAPVAGPESELRQVGIGWSMPAALRLGCVPGSAVSYRARPWTPMGLAVRACADGVAGWLFDCAAERVQTTVGGVTSTDFPVCDPSAGCASEFAGTTR